ncbi:MAG: ATP-binding protein [Bacteroidota bacterium]
MRKPTLKKQKVSVKRSHGTSEVLSAELNWLAAVIEARLHHYFTGNQQDLPKLPKPPAVKKQRGMFAEFVKEHQLSFEERLIIALALAPQLHPSFLDQIIAAHIQKAGDFPQLGGVRGTQHRGFLPTGETALFLLAGDYLSEKLKVRDLLDHSHWLLQKKVVLLDSPPKGEPEMSGKLRLDEDYVDLFIQDKNTMPKLSTTFPAQHIETKLSWDDLVLSSTTMATIQDIQDWIENNDILMHDWGMDGKLKPGYRALFHGPSGTGKTLTASLLGKYTNKPVFRVDLSLVISKFIGETEKNLATLFDKAENKNWILFFDEADALFGKRTSTKDAHDKYANQEVSYLLQRVEAYPGLVILASNFKSNIDDAFARRFQAIAYFPMPKAQERLILWRKAFPAAAKLGPQVNLETLAQQFEVTGANIMNVIQYASIKALARKDNTIMMKDILKGLQIEFSKEGKVA